MLQKLKHENVYSKDFLPRAITKPDGRVIKLATFGDIKAAFASNAKVLDVRDQSEVDQAKGGKTVDDAVHAPVNVNGQAQATHQTTLEEYKAALTAAGVDVANHEPGSFVVHCTGGGRAEKVCGFLRELGFTALNGGGAKDVALCFEETKSKETVEVKVPLFKIPVKSSTNPEELVSVNDEINDFLNYFSDFKSLLQD